MNRNLALKALVLHPNPSRSKTLIDIDKIRHILLEEPTKTILYLD